MDRVCVFCGSSVGVRPVYAEAASLLAEELIERGWRLIYGGGNIGLMGVLADRMLSGGGQVVGVIPQALAAREVAHAGLTQLHIVDSMHERKALMAELADAFVALPGGFGTLEEFCEVLTWAQLGLHRKPCGLLDVGAYFQPLLALFDQAVREGFLRSEHRQLVLVEHTPGKLLDALSAFQPPPLPTWIDRQDT